MIMCKDQTVRVNGHLASRCKQFRKRCELSLKFYDRYARIAGDGASLAANLETV